VMPWTMKVVSVAIKMLIVDHLRGPAWPAP